MKAFISLAVALTAIPAGVAAAQSAGPPQADALPLPAETFRGTGAAPVAAAPDPAAQRARIQRLARQAARHSTRLGLVPPAPVRPAAGRLAAHERRLASVVRFLDGRREIDAALDERRAPAPRARLRAHARAGGLTARIVREHRRAVRRAVRLGIEPPAPLRLARSAAGRRAQLTRLTDVSSWLADREERVRRDERPLSQRMRHYAALTCIAEHESGGRWDISTGNGYYGGLQMDRTFQRTYAPGIYRAKGTADNWTREEQMRTAERAIRSRGFTPWPNTARMCGLL